MSLYRNINQWDFALDLGIGEHVAWVRHPFFEYKLDPIYKIIQIHDNFYADIEVVSSSFIDVGTLIENQSLRTMRRVKLILIHPDYTYNKKI